MHKIKPWYQYPGMKKRYYEELRYLDEAGFTRENPDEERLIFIGELQYGGYSAIIKIYFRDSHPYHSPAMIIDKLNGVSFNDCIPAGWRHVAPDGTLCLYDNKSDKWSTSTTSRDIINRVKTWLEANVDCSWSGLEVDGPDPDFFNPYKQERACYITDEFMNVPVNVSGEFTFYYKKDGNRASASIKELIYHNGGLPNKLVNGNYLIPVVLPVESRDVRRGFFFTVDGKLPYRTEHQVLLWVQNHPGYIELMKRQKRFWFYTGKQKRAARRKNRQKRLINYPPIAIAIGYKDERTAAHQLEQCWVVFIMEGRKLSFEKGKYSSYPPVYVSEESRMVRSLQVSLKDRSIAIVGCGAIGSEIAMQLGKNGVGKLLLMDSDYLNFGNTYRHTLNLRDLQKNKADALKNQILMSNPYCQITTATYPVDLTLQHTEWFLDQVQKYDFVVVAVGDRSSYYYISWMLKVRNVPHMLVWTNWGAHGAEIVFINSNSGCMNCYDLRKQTTEIPSLKEAEKQHAVYDGGCGFPTTPGNSFDIGLVGHYSARKVVEYLQGKATSGYIHISLDGADPLFTSGLLTAVDTCGCSRIGKGDIQ